MPWSKAGGRWAGLGPEHHGNMQRGQGRGIGPPDPPDPGELRPAGTQVIQGRVRGNSRSRISVMKRSIDTG